MEVFECAATRLETREYQDRPVPMKAIREILEAGRLSPSAMNQQPWNFIVVRDRETLRKIGALSPSGPYIADAAFAIAIAVDPDNRWHQIDTARAAQSMMLVAWSHGVGSRWVGNIRRDEVKRLLEVPEELHIITVLPFGYPKHPAKGVKNRRPLSEIAHLERFGEQFPSEGC